LDQDDFRYDDLIATVKIRFPQLRKGLDRFIAQWNGEELPMHLAFSEVIYEHLSNAANDPTELDELAMPLFTFLEKMALHPDNEVRNVAYVSICEPICANEALLQKTRRYMGPAIRKFCDQIIEGS